MTHMPALHIFNIIGKKIPETLTLLQSLTDSWHVEGNLKSWNGESFLTVEKLRYVRQSCKVKSYLIPTILYYPFEIFDHDQ